MAVVIIADVMDLLDATIANLAGPSIQADLGGSQSTLQWVLAAYTMSFAVGLVVSARAGDLVGRRRMFIIGMAGFTVASLLCGLAPTAGALIAFRVLQGLFGAVMIPQGLAMVKQSFHPDDLQKAFIPFGPIMGLAAVLGPILAGFLIDADLFGTGWRMIFLINIPVGIVGTFLAVKYLPETPTRPRGEARRRGLAAAGRRLGAADLPAGAGPRARLAALVLPHDGRVRDRLRRRSWSASDAARTR